MFNASLVFHRAGWLLLAAPFFGFATGALFPLVALQLSSLGFGETFIGSVTSFYYAGSVTGALTYGWFLNRVGYKVGFLVMALLAAATTYALTQFDTPALWLGLRFIGGYALGGYYIVVDSWVVALGTRRTRGQLLACFETLRLLATAIGPGLLVVGPSSSPMALVAIGYAVSFVPALFNDAPKPKTKDRELSGGLMTLARCFPFALGVAFCGGIANASFYGLSAVYANALGYQANQIALFVGLVLVAPAVIAIPVGILADRFRRMPVALPLAACSLLACGFVSLTEPTSFWVVTLASVVAGGCLVPLYVLGLARIVDAVGEQDAILATTAGLLTYNAGALCGPIAAGFVMELSGPTGLYMFLGCVAALAMGLAIADQQLSRCCPERVETAPA